MGVIMPMVTVVGVLVEPWIDQVDAKEQVSVGEKLRRGPIGHNLMILIEYQDAIGNLFHDIELVSSGDKRFAKLAELHQHVEQPPSGARIKSCRRFIEEQYRWIRGHDRSQGYLFFLSPAQFERRPILNALQAEKHQNFPNPLPDFGFVQSQVQGPESDLLPDGG